jgi:hypothetical protein
MLVLTMECIAKRTHQHPKILRSSGNTTFAPFAWLKQNSNLSIATPLFCSAASFLRDNPFKPMGTSVLGPNGLLGKGWDEGMPLFSLT